MNFNIRMGIPEMQEIWLDLQEKYRSGNIKKKEEQLYKKWGKALKLLSADPGYPSLQTHEIEPLSRRYGMKVRQSYLENKTSGAMRMYWVYGPDQKDITIIGLEPHPEDKKNGAYDRISLSDLQNKTEYGTDKKRSAGPVSYTHLSAELLAPEAANKLLDKIRDAIAALSFMPKKYALIEEEPWKHEGDVYKRQGIH